MFLDNPREVPPAVIHMRLRAELRNTEPGRCQDAVLDVLAHALLEVGGEASFAWTIRSLSPRECDGVHELVPLPDQLVSNAAACALAAALRRQPLVAAVDQTFP
jgi:hypothetical protein